MKNKKNVFTGLVTVVIFLVAGFGVLGFFVKIKKGPQKNQQAIVKMPVTAVRVIKTSINPTIRAYGTVRASTQFNAVSEVSGKLIFVDPALKKGAILPKGTLLFQIDPIDYQLKADTAKAELDQILANENEVNVNLTNLRALLKLETLNQLIAKKEFDRQKNLILKKSISQSAFDTAKIKKLGYDQKVIALKNSIALIPASLKKINASKKLFRLKIKEAQRLVEKTKLILPFNARIGNVNLESNQFVSMGSPLFTAYGTDPAEIDINISLDDLNTILPLNGLDSIKQISAKITLPLKHKALNWTGKVSRISEQLDSMTRTIGLTIKMDKTPLSADNRLPILPGMFVNLTLKNPDSKKLFSIPRHAIENNTVLIATPDGLLEKRGVTSLFMTAENAFFENGFTEGEQIITSAIVPAVEGMSLKVISND